MSVYLHGSDYEYIEEEANNLVEDLGLRVFPLDCFEVARLLGIVLMPYSELPEHARNVSLSKSEDGYSIKRKGVYVICYNDEKPATRIKFTIWHEIAHIQLGHLDGCEKTAERIEAEANHFAAYILAPLAFVFQLELETPCEIADSFGISIDCACNVYEHYQKVMWKPRVRQKILCNKIARILTYIPIEGVTA